ncbi:Uncharacterized protein Tcan_07723 [Toxocara canis]|uniref:Uncharacterized protein n=1 Tax=Toxocara canis TaxID=6265 RepID=A0A0B2UVP3_TOXCA|nr:Uncharacterized protein Tcan_07723 [Toxocara canis]
MGMLDSPHSSVRTSPKMSSEVIRAALEREVKMSRFHTHRQNAIIWATVALFLFLELIVLRGFLLNWLLCALFESWKEHMAAITIELPLFVICTVNVTYCLIGAITNSLLTPHTADGKLTDEQMCLLGLTDKEYRKTPRPSPKKLIASDVSPSVDHKFCFEWLSALRFDSSLPHRSPPSWSKEATSVHAGSSDVSLAEQSSFYETGSALNASVYSNLTSNASMVGRVSHNSSYSKPTSSVQTSKQLDKLIAESPLLDSSSLSSSAVLGSTSFPAASPGNLSFGSSFGSGRVDPTMGYYLLDAEGSRYDLGTALNGDDNAKDGGGVVSLVAGSQISVTPSRISLSPIPLNLSNVSQTQLADDESLLDGKSAVTASSVSSRADLDESISFRVAVNARAKQQSPKRSTRSPSPLSRRSDSWERRRLSSLSQQRLQPGDTLVDASSGSLSEQISPMSSSSVSKQFALTSEILNQYKLDAERFSRGERYLRCWLCQTIVRPLVANINRMNEILAEDYPHLHLKIGRSSVEAIQVALSSKGDLLCTVLPYLLPYLRAHEKQAYIVKRANELSADDYPHLHLKIGRSSVEAIQVALSSKGDLLCTVLPYLLPYLRAHEKQAYIVKRANELSADVYMKEFNWQGGGSESIEKGNDNPHAYTPSSAPWADHLPTDTQLIWSWFCTYLDARMGANPMVADLNAPFTSVFFLKKPNKPSAVQCCSDSFYVHQSSIHPPHFEFVVDGGRERFEVGRGARNFWRIILLFIQHARLFNNNRIGSLCIDESGINVACVVAECTLNNEQQPATAYIQQFRYRQICSTVKHINLPRIRQELFLPCHSLSLRCPYEILLRDSLSFVYTRHYVQLYFSLRRNIGNDEGRLCPQDHRKQMNFCRFAKLATATYKSRWMNMNRDRVDKIRKPPLTPFPGPYGDTGSYKTPVDKATTHIVATFLFPSSPLPPPTTTFSRLSH